jgi:hypothetical protein
MEGSSSSDYSNINSHAKPPKSITGTKKKGGFLFASVPQQSEEDASGREGEQDQRGEQLQVQQQQQHQALDREVESEVHETTALEPAASPPSSPSEPPAGLPKPPSDPPVAAVTSPSSHSRIISSLEIWTHPSITHHHRDRAAAEEEDADDMATASSLRERLRQYQSLKEQMNQPAVDPDEGTATTTPTTATTPDTVKKITLRDHLRSQNPNEEPIYPAPALGGGESADPPAGDGADDDVNSFLGPPTTASASAASAAAASRGTDGDGTGGTESTRDVEAPGEGRRAGMMAWQL